MLGTYFEVQYSVSDNKLLSNRLFFVITLFPDVKGRSKTSVSESYVEKSGFLTEDNGAVSEKPDMSLWTTLSLP